MFEPSFNDHHHILVNYNKNEISAWNGGFHEQVSSHIAFLVQDHVEYHKPFLFLKITQIRLRLYQDDASQLVLKTFVLFNQFMHLVQHQVSYSNYKNISSRRFLFLSYYIICLLNRNSNKNIIFLSFFYLFPNQFIYENLIDFQYKRKSLIYNNLNQLMLNIPSTVVDNNYRYRMPKMQLKIQSKGNGIKTNIVNLPDVAKSLRTDQTYILKFFGYEKASQTIEKSSENKSNKTAKVNTSYIIQGSFSDEELLKTLDRFIEKYILCPKCKLPELNMYIVNEKILGKCDSCPFNGQMDSKHKIATHIIKKPPLYKPQNINAPKIIDKQPNQKEQEQKKQKNGKIKKNEIPEKKIEQVKQQHASKLFSADTLQFGSPQMQNLIEYTRKFIEARKSQDFDMSCAQTVDNLKPLCLKKTLFAFVIFNSLFTVNIGKQVQQNAPMYKRLMKRLVGSSDQNNETQTLLNTQYLFLQTNRETDYSKYIATILFKMHESQLFSKQFLLKWEKGQIKDFDKYFLYNDTRNQQFLKNSQAFINSLKEEDQEDDD